MYEPEEYRKFREYETEAGMSVKLAGSVRKLPGCPVRVSNHIQPSCPFQSMNKIIIASASLRLS